MKKSLWIALVLMLVCIFSFSACDKGDTPPVTDDTSSACEHIFGEWNITKQATCKDEGEKVRVCSKCSEEEITTIEKTDIHTEVVDVAVSASCEETGLTEGKHCSQCNKVIVAQTTIDAFGHKDDNNDHICDNNCGKNDIGTHADSNADNDHVCDYGCGAVLESCSDKTNDGDHSCDVCDKADVSVHTSNTPTCESPSNCTECGIITGDALGHIEVIDTAVAATCTTDGKTEGKHCSRCSKIFVAQTTIGKFGHTEVVDTAVTATCSMEGKTEGKHCSVCNTVIVAQESIEKLPHTEVVDEAITPTCTKTGLTEGKHCSVCNEVITAQNVLDALPHNSQKTHTKSTCLTSATIFEKCVVCGFENTITLEPIEANINITGVGSIVSTAGSYTYHDYTVVASGGCGEYKYKFELFRYSSSSTPIDTLESTDPSIQLKNANNYYLRITITDEFGESVTYTTYVGSGTSTKQPSNNHTIVIDAMVEATCVATGLTEGSHCSTCNEILVAQQTISTKSHSSSSWIVDTDSTCTQEGSKHKECTVCGTVTTTATISKKAHENGEWIVDKEATCTEKGSRHQICSVCSDTINTEVIETGSHTYVAEHDLTYLNTYGFDKYTCSICKYTAYVDKDQDELELAELILSTDGTTVQSCSNVDTAELLIIPDTVTAFEDDGLFVYCDSLKYVLFGSNSIKLRLQGAPIKHMYIPTHVTVQLPYCKKLETIIWADGVTKIDAYGIYSGCVGRTMSGSSIKSIVIPLSVTTIKSGVFSNASNLSVVYYMGNAEDWGNITIEADDTSCLLGATIYYYSEKYPTASGNYWRYVDGVPTIWDTENHIHSEGVNVSVEPTCTTEGFTGKQCPVCGEILSIVTTVDALGHTEVIDKALAPTCTTTGLTEGKHCSVCTEVVVVQTVVNRLPHSVKNGKCENCNIRSSSDGLECVLNSDGQSYTVTGIGTCSSDELIIGLYNGLPITVIERAAFKGCTNLKTVIIDDCVTTIYPYAFEGCTGLENITIPFIGQSANATGYAGHFGYIFGFGYYSSSSYQEPNYYDYYDGENYYCYFEPSSSLKVILGDNVTTIGDYAFRNYVSLKEIVIPNSVTSIGKYAFELCIGLEAIDIPNSVISIGASAFQSCHLTSIEIPYGVTSIGNAAFLGCNSLTNVIIPTSVTSIGSSAFAACTKLMGIQIPSSISVIKEATFSGCFVLEHVIISSSVKQIEKNAFFGCHKIAIVDYNGDVEQWKQIEFGDGNEYLLSATWHSTSQDTYWNCANGVLTIWNSIGLEYTLSDDGSSYIVTGFDNKQNAVSIPSSYNNLPVTAIGNQAFYECDNLVRITIPDSITSIGEYAFAWCDNLMDITLPDNITSIGDYAFENCDSLSYTIYNNGKYLGSKNNPYIVLVDVSDTSVSSFDIPDNTKFIYYSAFSRCSNLTSIIIPDSVEGLGSYAFYYCTSLSTLTLSNSLRYIGSYAFDTCTKLVNIELPESITSIGSSAFKRTGYYNDTANWDGDVLYIGSYLIAANTSISGNCTIKDGTRVIADSAFGNCDSLTSVFIPSSITNIGQNVFAFSNSLTSIIVSSENSNYTSVDGNLYNKGCTTLIQYSIGKTDSLFEIPESVTSISGCAFYDCTNLTDIIIPDSVISIGDKAFAWCANLTNISIGNGVTSIGEWAFYKCTSLVSVTVPNSVTIIGKYAFYNCTSLANLTLGKGVALIDDDAFSNCSNLSIVYYAGTETEWNAISIGLRNSALTSASRQCCG